MFLQQVTLSIILLSSLAHGTTLAMENPEKNPEEVKPFRKHSWSRTSSGTMYYSYPTPNNITNNPCLNTPAAFETEFRYTLSLNMNSHRSRGKSNDFLANYEAKQLQYLKRDKQIIIERQNNF